MLVGTSSPGCIHACYTVGFTALCVLQKSRSSERKLCEIALPIQMVDSQTSAKYMEGTDTANPANWKITEHLHAESRGLRGLRGAANSLCVHQRQSSGRGLQSGGCRNPALAQCPPLPHPSLPVLVSEMFAPSTWPGMHTCHKTLATTHIFYLLEFRILGINGRGNDGSFKRQQTAWDPHQKIE